MDHNLVPFSMIDSGKDRQRVLDPPHDDHLRECDYDQMIFSEVGSHNGEYWSVTIRDLQF